MRISTSISLAWLLLASTIVQAAPEVSFADLPEGRTAIVDDPAYFDHLQPMEIEAKTGRPLMEASPAAQRAECRRRYQAAVREFTADEKCHIESVVELIDPAIRNDYPALADTPWNFVKVASNIEAGFPHTRGKYIILAESVCRWLRGPGRWTGGACPWTRWNCSCTSRCTFFSGPTGRFSIRFTGPMGLYPGETIVTCPWIVEHQLLNPDAVDCPWVFPLLHGDGRQYIWPLFSFNGGPGPKRMQSDASMLAVYVTPSGDGFRVQQSADGRPKYSELLSVRDYREVFLQSTNIYHPHEASADLFAKLVVFDRYSSVRMNAAQQATMEKSFGPLREWFKKNLRKP